MPLPLPLRSRAPIPSSSPSTSVLPTCYVYPLFFFSSRRRHTRSLCDWSSDVCSSDLEHGGDEDSAPPEPPQIRQARTRLLAALDVAGASLPGDEWIVGQRVRYLLEDSQPRLAARAVERSEERRGGKGRRTGWALGLRT